MTHHYFVMPVVVSLFALACVGTAHGQDDAERLLLRQEFRAALEQDPRAAQLSPERLDSLVEQLATEAEAQNSTSDFVLPMPPAVENTFNDNAILTPWGQPIDPSVLYALVLCSLASAGGLLWWLLHLHRSHLRQQ